MERMVIGNGGEDNSGSSDETSGTRTAAENFEL
jgi:hypothetical protein